jgi:hypothetical protein
VNIKAMASNQKEVGIVQDAFKREEGKRRSAADASLMAQSLMHK